MYFRPYYYYDPTYILVLIGVILSVLASAWVKSSFNKYSRVRNMRGLTGKDAAERILHANGIYDVQVQRVPGNLTDHYDPVRKVLRLSDSVYSSDSVAAIGVAAHECGHALQHANGYFPLRLRGALVPVANFGATLAWPLVLIGLLINSESSMMFIHLGILLFSFAVLFHIVTLPVEFNASRRALNILKNSGMLYEGELYQTTAVLRAAAMTYVASAAAMILQLLRLIMVGGRKRDD